MYFNPTNMAEAGWIHKGTDSVTLNKLSNINILLFVRTSYWLIICLARNFLSRIGKIPGKHTVCTLSTTEDCDQREIRTEHVSWYVDSSTDTWNGSCTFSVLSDGLRFLWFIKVSTWHCVVNMVESVGQKLFHRTLAIISVKTSQCSFLWFLCTITL